MTVPFSDEGCRPILCVDTENIPVLLSSFAFQGAQKGGWLVQHCAVFPSKYWASWRRDSSLHVPLERAADKQMKPLLTKGWFSCKKAGEESLSRPCRICCESVHHFSNKLRLRNEESEGCF